MPAYRICSPVAWRRLLLCSARENWFPGCAKWFFLWRVAPPAKGDSDLPPVSRPTGFVSGTHLVWYLSRRTYRRRVYLPWRLLATTPGINWRPGAGGGISCAEGDSGPPRDGREPSWARPCEASGALFLSNGGSGGGHETCTLWPPPAPFGYFPVWESTSSARRRTKPPTRN